MSEYVSDFNTAFNHNLVLALELEADGKTVNIHTGNIEKFNLNLHAYGHSGIIQFTGLNNAELDSLFRPEKVIKVTLAFKSADPLTGMEMGAPQLEIKGIVTHRCLKRLTSHLDVEKKPLRLYEITFVDAAKATWTQHFPINAYVDQSMKDVFEQHVNPEISLKFDWDKLDTKHPITAFSLPHKEWLPEQQQISFYSFFIWYLHKENGVLAYDYKAHSYTLLGKKAPHPGKPFTIFEEWVDPPVCIFPNPPRYNINKLKPSFDNVEKEDKENKEVFKSVKRVSIKPENYRCYPEQACETFQTPLIPEKNCVEAEFNHFDDALSLEKLVPGMGVCFKGDKGGRWSEDECYKGKNYIVQSLHIQAERMDETDELPKFFQTFNMQMKAILEEEGEPYIPRPAFTPPEFPFTVLGTVFSDIGDKEQSTYKILESEKAPQGQYLVKVPLVEGDKKVVVPFTPDFISGQFYFPFTKGQRVEVAMYLHTAKIQRPGDWQPLARLPMGLQANQIMLASNGKDKYTYLRHDFEDGKNSVFTIKQSSSETQTQTIQIKEKDTLITVEEKDKKTLFIQMNNETGITFSLEDKTASVTQQTIFDGKSMTHTCKGNEGTSTCIQKPDSITFDCKKFSVTCDEYNVDAKDSISQKGANKFDLESKVANLKAKSVKMG